MRPTSAPLAQLDEATRLQILVDGISDHALYMLDPDGVVVTWNSGAHRLKGYSPSEIIGQSFSCFFSAEDRAAGLPQTILGAAKQAGRYEAEGWRYRKDGSRFWANAVVDAIRDGQGGLVGFAKITRDISERAANQEALLASERRFRVLVQGIVDYAIYMLDPGGIVTNWNPGAERMKGYSSDDIVGQHFSEFYSHEDRVAGLPARALDRAIREGRHEAEGWRVRKDGSRFWASVTIDAIRNEDGELIGFAKITRDITERRAAQEALRESERQLRLLVRGVTDYALYMLDPNGIVTNWNAGAERIKGYLSDEIVGQHFSRFYTQQERAAGVPARALYTAEHEGRYEAEGWRLRKDGTQFWANVVIDPIRDEEGHLVGFAKITRDMTEKRKAQLANQEAQIQRAQAQKMEALGQLTGGVAHDFNNLLMIVSGHVHTLKKVVGEDPRGRRAIDAIQTASQRGAALTRQLLSFSRRQVLNPVTLDLKERLDGILPLVESSLGPGVRLAVTAPPKLWAVKVDINELELALINLIINARDALTESGVITISGENRVLARSGQADELHGEFVMLSVADTGTGIAADVLPKVFDPFFTTKEASKGSGLGLSQVHGFAHQSGGTVRIESKLGEGTRVTLYLPRAQGGVQSELAQAEPEASSGRVLLVEDNPDVAEASSVLLEQLGYEVRLASSGTAALTTLKDHPFDLVISDIVMPGPVDGLALARTIRQQQPQLPILLVTGYSQAIANAEGVFPVLRKPYQIEELSRITTKLMTEARQPPGRDNLVHLSNARGAPRGGSR
jgi:PAS domain S-box-containing protein